MLEISGLDLFYGDAQALADISLHADEAAIIAIIGANGAGKSSLIRTIAGIERPRRGSIRFCGREIAGFPPHIVCNLGLGQVAEGRQIFPNLTVADNLDVGSLVPRGRPHKRASLERVTTCSRALRNAPDNMRVRNRAASSRCWQSAAV